MGNMVSSLVVYALQAAWFCQRLIDQDYRQNHGSRTKPIMMNIDVTDLDVFLSKCRSYYLSKRTRHRALEDKRKWTWRSEEDDAVKCHNDAGFRQIVLSPAQANGLVMKEEDLTAFLSDRAHVDPLTRAKTERWKRKKSYYRKRYNPRRGPDRATSSFPLDERRNDIEDFVTSAAERLETSAATTPDDLGRLRQEHSYGRQYLPDPSCCSFTDTTLVL